MGERTTLIEMELFNQIKVIDYWINECSSNNYQIELLITEVRSLVARALDKQQTITENTIMKQAKDVDLSRMEIWGTNHEHIKERR